LRIRSAVPPGSVGDQPGNPATQPTSRRLVSGIDELVRSRSARALAGTIVGNATGFIFPFLLTWRFGAGRFTDAYFFGYAIANYATSTTTNTLVANVVPVAQLHLRGGAEALQRFLRRTVSQAIPILLALYVLVGAIAAAVVLERGNWTATEKATCIQVIVLFVPLIVAVAATSVYTAGIYATDEFWWPTMTQGIGPLVAIAIVSVIPPGRVSLTVVSLGIAVGETLRLLLLSRRLRLRVADVAHGETSSGTVSVWRTAAPHALALAVSAASPVIDRAVAATLATGSVTLIDLGERIFFVPQLALTSSVVLVAGTRWSVRERDDRWLFHDYRRVVLQLFVLGAGLAIAVVAMLGLIRLVIGPVFAGVDTDHLVAVTAILLMGLPFGAAASSGARMLAARRRTAVLPFFAASTFTVNLGADLVGAHSFGVDGIVASSSLVRLVQCCAYLVVCRRMLVCGRRISD
jgi:peptidoglycan biosynthesis protein MviN/MurJ (putative lipid II flippase)